MDLGDPDLQILTHKDQAAGTQASMALDDDPFSELVIVFHAIWIV